MSDLCDHCGDPRAGCCGQLDELRADLAGKDRAMRAYYDEANSKQASINDLRALLAEVVSDPDTGLSYCPICDMARADDGQLPHKPDCRFAVTLGREP